MAWMGPFGYVLAEKEAGVRAIATAKYDEKPIYHAIVVAQPGSGIERWPQDAEGKSISFADIGTEIVWRSDPLPNDAIALSRNFAPELEVRVKEALLSLTPEQAAEILPDRYTGFVEGDSETYAPIREAAQALDVLEE